MSPLNSGWAFFILRLRRGVDHALEAINKYPLAVKDAWITKVNGYDT